MLDMELHSEGVACRLQVARKGLSDSGTGRVNEYGDTSRRGQQDDSNASVSLAAEAVSERIILAAPAVIAWAVFVPSRRGSCFSGEIHKKEPLPVR
jgi:hypothetical protein